MDILIVEDEEGIREYYKDLLEDLIEDAKFITTDSIEGLEKALKDGIPDILLLDCNLVDGNGYMAFMDYIEDYPKLQDTLKFFVSGIPYADMVIEFSPSGAKMKNSYVLNKPVMGGLFRMVINRHFDKG